MGDVADAILEGDLCQGCGVYIGPGNGYPRWCKQCRSREPSRQKQRELRKVHPNARTIPCPGCGKRFSTEQARDQHVRDKHGKED